MSLGIVMEFLYGEVGKVLRGVVEVDAVLFVAEEVAGPDISDKGSEVLPTSIILFMKGEALSRRETLRSSGEPRPPPAL